MFVDVNFSGESHKSEKYTVYLKIIEKKQSMAKQTVGGNKRFKW